MQEILRQLIWIQNYEIQLMKNISQNMILNESNDRYTNYTITIADLTKPNEIGLTKTYCDSNFFDPENTISI
jgi:hypothetical protein